ncbi:MAG: hypothetical protein QM756_32135 [Polyangiaceae bacterium]
MTRVTPPGYASVAGTTTGVAFPVAVCVFACATLATTFYEVCLATPRAYAPLGGPSYAAVLALGAALGGYALRSRGVLRLSAPSGCAASALVAAACAPLFACSFAHGAWLGVVGVVLPVLGGLCCGATLSALLAEFGRGLLSLEVLSYLANPFRLALVSALWLLTLLAFPSLGIWRRGALLSALLAAASVLLPFVARLLALPEQRSPSGRLASSVAPFAALASLLSAGLAVPIEAVRRRAGEVVYVLDGPRGTHVVSRSQGGMLLFSNDVLAITSNDAARFAEALVHPAFALAARRAQVLLLDDGNGSLPREALRYTDVAELWLVPHDPALSRLAQRSAWFSELGASSLRDARVRLVEREAAPFVLGSERRFDVIVLNASDPSSYLSGKYFSRLWLSNLRQHLSPGGVIALQATSPLRTPRVYRSILETLRSAGFSVLPLRAALPTLGEWGVALAFADDVPLAQRLQRAHPIAQGTGYVDDRSLPLLLAPRSEPTTEEPPLLNTAFEQPLVELYRHEDRAYSD